MQRKQSYCCERRVLPRRRAEIMLGQDGRCAECGTRRTLGFFVFDHRPPLALREEADDPNDPERLADLLDLRPAEDAKGPEGDRQGESASPTSTRISWRGSRTKCRGGQCRRGHGYPGGTPVEYGQLGKLATHSLFAR